MSDDYYPLNTHLQQHKIDLKEFLELSIKLCKTLHTLHEEKTIYGTLSPSVILVNNNKEIILSASGEDVSNENRIYRAPEQILGASQPINNAADIYTLGIIFYEMLLGKVPYRYSDLLEFSHTLVTRNIPLISTLDDTIPTVVSKIVEKMIFKNQFERYKNILSVYVDLSKVLRDLNTCGEVNEFKIDTFNSILDLYTTNLIYGREEEKKKLQGLIDSRSETSNSIITLSGTSGVGKSSLVDFILKENHHLFSYILKFKLEEGKQNTPYEILYTALRDLTKQIISQDEALLEKHRENLQQILGAEAQILIDVIPEIETIIGSQPKIKDLNITETKVRFDSLLLQFMKYFFNTGEPLCIYIDDLQWSDPITVKWIEDIVLNLKSVLTIMTYREDSDREYHVFNTILDKLQPYDINIAMLTILPISEDDIYRLITDNMQLEEAKEVAHTVFLKTKGNPFFVKQYLKELQNSNGIWFDLESFGWNYDIEKIKKLQMSDNVFDILSNNLDQLHPNVLKLLQLASCFGNIFTNNLLEKIYNDDTSYEHSLGVTLKEGWLTEIKTNHTLESSYHFSHDKMHEVIYSSIGQESLKRMHYDIGYCIFSTNETLDNQNLIISVNHLNIGYEHLEDKQLLVELNMQASVHAKKSGDFDNALQYIRKAMQLADNQTLNDKYALMVKERAECEHLCHNSEQAEIYYEIALESSEDKLIKGEIYELMIKFYSDISNFQKAYDIGRTATELFGISIPKKFIPLQFALEFISLKLKLRAYKVEEFINLPQSDDVMFKMTIRLLANTLQAAYQIKPELSVANALIIVKLCLKHGLTKESVIGFTVFGVIFQGAILGNHELGFKYSEFSLDMLEKFDNTIQHSEVKFVCGYFATSWKQASSKTEANWHISYQNGLEIGDWFHTGCAAAGIIQSMFMRGVHFEKILEQIGLFEAVLENIGASEQLGAMTSVKQTILNLTKQKNVLGLFDAEGFDEPSYVKDLDTYNSEHFAHYYFINKMIFLYFHKEYQKGFDISQKGMKFSKSSQGMLHNTEHIFYDALILAQLIEDTNVKNKIQYKRSIDKAKKKFLKWADVCPENFLVRATILQGELCRIANDHTKALWHYERAIEAAKIYGQVHLQAIANRLTAQMYDGLKQIKIANLYYEDALKNLHEWGMEERKFTELNDTVDFDIMTLIKASEVIAKEQRLPYLLKTLIQIIIENASAQHGFLLLKEDNDMFVQAYASVDTEAIDIMKNIPYMECDNIVHPIINYVMRTSEAMIIDDMHENHIFSNERTVKRELKSILCAPLMLQGELKGIIYLENNLLTGVFTDDKIKLLQYLSGQIAISIENALVYNSLEEKIKERTKDLEESQEELKFLASTDSMTKLYNRRYFIEAAEHTLSLAKRERKDVSIIMLDIDNFKRVNDSYGHKVGDELIITFASTLQELTRNSDIICRFGGEEFLILLPHTDINGANFISEKIRLAVEALVMHIEDKQQLQFTVSIGVSHVDTQKDLTIEAPINRADKALYEAKKNGRNRVCTA